MSCSPIASRTPIPGDTPLRRPPKPHEDPFGILEPRARKLPRGYFKRPAIERTGLFRAEVLPDHREGPGRRVLRKVGRVSHLLGKEKINLAMCLSTHDDDSGLSVPTLTQQMIREKIPVMIVIATNGQAGWKTLDEKKKITQIRKQEAIKAYTMLGVPKKNIIFLDIPDGRTGQWVGEDLERPIVAQLRNGLTVRGKVIQPDILIAQPRHDLHRDHVHVFDAAMLSLFHAMGEIWLQATKGEPLKVLPNVFTSPVYCLPENKLADAIVHRTAADRSIAIKSLCSYQSQLPNIRGVTRRFVGAPFELLYRVEFPLYTVESACMIADASFTGIDVSDLPPRKKL